MQLGMYFSNNLGFQRVYNFIFILGFSKSFHFYANMRVNTV